MKTSFGRGVKMTWMVKVVMVVITFHLASVTSTAQIRFGLKGGVQIANMEFEARALKSSNRVGFFVGPTVKFNLPIQGLSVDIVGLYDRRDLKIDEETFKQESVIVQGNLRIGAGISESLGIFIKGGPQFSFNSGDDIIHWVKGDESKQFTLQETMMSFNLGAGLTLAKHFEVSLGYNIPISKTGDFTWDNFADEMREQSWKHAKSSTNAWNVSLAYYF